MDHFNSKKYRIYANFLNKLAKDLTSFYYSKLNKTFKVSDLESLNGLFHTVICLDVFIHYPQKAAEEMVRHLCNLTEKRLIVSFAPYTPLLALLKTIGQFLFSAKERKDII